MDSLPHSACPNCGTPMHLHPERDIERGVFGQKRCDEAEMRLRALEYQ